MYFSQNMKMSIFINKNVLFYLKIFIALVLLACVVLYQKYSNPSTEHKAKLRTVFGDRYSTIRKACVDPKIQALDKVEVPHFRFVYDGNSKLLTCTTAKHGSTTWSNYFVTLFQNGQELFPLKYNTELRIYIVKSEIPIISGTINWTLCL